jgi:hypothetical protein
MAEKESPEPEPQAEPELDSLTEDQLRDMIDGAAAEPPPPAEPVAAEVIEPVAPPEEPEPADVNAAPDAAPDIASEVESLRVRFEQAELQRQAQEERNKHLEFLLSRRSGEIGDLRQKLRTAPQPQGDDYEPAPQPEQVAPAPSELHEWRQERVLEAAQKTYDQAQAASAQFWKSLEARPEADRKEFDVAFQDNLKREVARYESDVRYAYAKGDPKMMASIIRASYGAALADARAAFANKILERKRTTADQSSTLKQRKLAAAAGASGTRQVPRAAPKKLDDMTPDELKSEIDRRSESGIFVG